MTVYILILGLITVNACTGTDTSSESSVTTGTTTEPEDSSYTEDTCTAESTESLVIETTEIEEPDQAGNDYILFDIYRYVAKADLNSDGYNETIVLYADDITLLRIDDKEYQIDIEGLEQAFAVTDIDSNDGYLEIVLTRNEKTGVSESYFPSSYLFWWNGEDLLMIGILTNISFFGTSRISFDPALYFDSKGTVFIPTLTTEIIEIWYMGRYHPSGEGRYLEEELYITEPLNHVEDLKLKSGYMCALLFEISEIYYDDDHKVLWDYASWPHINGREIDPYPEGIFSIITSGPEVLKIIYVYGKNWLMLYTEDGYEGWICLKDNKVRGYDNVMYIDIYDMFE